jgi:hypothetical protein
MRSLNYIAVTLFTAVSIILSVYGCVLSGSIANKSNFATNVDRFHCEVNLLVSSDAPYSLIVKTCLGANS